MSMRFKEGEEQTVIFDINIDGIDYDLEEDVELKLVVEHLRGGVLFEKEDENFDKRVEDNEARVKFLSNDLSETGKFKAELRIKIYVNDVVGYVYKTKDKTIIIRRSLT